MNEPADLWNQYQLAKAKLELSRQATNEAWKQVEQAQMDWSNDRRELERIEKELDWQKKNERLLK
jgi:hypothetical protein